MEKNMIEIKRLSDILNLFYKKLQGETSQIQDEIIRKIYNRSREIIENFPKKLTIEDFCIMYSYKNNLEIDLDIKNWNFNLEVE